MGVDVYFSSLENKKFKTPLDKIKRLLEKCKIKEVFKKDEIIAIKLHFGELGNTAFIRPIYLRPIIEILKNIGAKPFLTDTNTLYVGMRTNSVDHLHNAYLNGFNYSTLQTPVIIADGLRGENTIDYEVNLELCKKVKLASDIVHSDGMICVSHFKAHELSGFGGAIKNLSMGCASRGGKLDMHSNARPFVKEKNCTSCKRCLTACQVLAIEMREKAFIRQDICVGCSRCVAVCPVQAISINWDASSDSVQKKMAEYAFGTVNALKKRILYINILTSIVDACDCYPGNSAPIVSDIGFLASTDPVAIDKASYDLVIKTNNMEDPFKKVYPHIDSLISLTHAAKIGAGTLDYNLIKID
ncbi:MAG TPA: DUF362 domain-containing protein [Spirochaetota bacterium]|nr:DUF362 domain-containing protein [Spirochaetota bacterium]HOL56197.1 DUF362 domain-containing protein [Spirochaetota bacterium]HPP03814.1 DUF362 domain-containing protein [Spirochaetota bacterium]